MLDTGTDLSDTILEELLGMDKFRLELIFVISGPQHVVVAHAPGIEFVAFCAQCVAVVAHRPHRGDSFSVERRHSIRLREVVNSRQVNLLRLTA